MFSNPIKANNFVETYKSFLKPSYAPYMTEDKKIESTFVLDTKTYMSSNQKGFIGHGSLEIEFYSKRLIQINDNSYKIELPKNTVIDGTFKADHLIV